MNTQQELEFAQKISNLLDQSTRELDAPIAAKLLEARKQALAHYDEKPAHAWVPAWATNTLGRITEPFSNHLGASVGLLALLLCLSGFIAWQNAGQQGSEIAELDQALLTDELPINAFLDKGFESWVRRP
ncbi:MAG: DUF3619 family protein [Betaproteobacteria bacterium]|nr:DUF3619 family protein [Betaproteobacteria bacterium]